MNYFAHGRDFLHEPYFLAGTAVPDWLNVVDRKVRVRAKHAATFLDNFERDNSNCRDPDVNDPDINDRSVADLDRATTVVARGIVQHHHDDGWFHETRAFAELSLTFTASIRKFLAPANDLRPTFLGHILVELLLDATLIAREPERLHAYYRAMEAVDPAVVERAINRIVSVRSPAFRRNETTSGTEPPKGGTTKDSPRPAVLADKLAPFLRVFCHERFLFDYSMDEKLTFRVNQILRRVGLPPVPNAFAALLPEARAAVADRADELLGKKLLATSD